MALKINQSAKALKRSIGKYDNQMGSMKAKMLHVAAKRRAAVEALRTITRREERLKLQMAKKPKDAKKGAGRPERWPGLCRACCMRWFGHGGGPGHFSSKLCDKTQKQLKTGKVKD